MNGQHDHDNYPPYSMIIEWSDEDGKFIVTLPELGGCHTAGMNYVEAARKGQELIEALVIMSRSDGDPLPEPKIFVSGWLEEGVTDNEDLLASINADAALVRS